MNLKLIHVVVIPRTQPSKGHKILLEEFRTAAYAVKLSRFINSCYSSCTFAYR